MQLRGCGTALVTPFHQGGSLDEPALRNLVSWQIESGIDFLVPCGTTGETPTLSFQHFKAIAEAVSKPVILYNVPGRTAANLEPSTVARLAEISNIAGVKEASGNLTQVAEICAAARPEFSVLSGDDATVLPVISVGGVGLISVASNEIPAEMTAIVRAALNNDWDGARQVFRKYLPLMQVNFIESSPMPVKAVLAMMGRIEEAYRLPMVQIRRDTRSKLQRIASELGLIARAAAAVAPNAPAFFVYENWAAGPHKAVLHRSQCGQCNSGKARPAGHSANHARWHGPYVSLSEARQVTQTLPNVLIRSECKCI